MSRHRRAAAAIAVLFALSACAKSSSIGKDVNTKVPTASATATATATKKPTRKATATAAPAKTTKAPGCNYKPRTVVIYIADVYNQYEPRDGDARVYQSDKIKFENRDRTNKHSLTENHPTPVFKTPLLSPGQSATISMNHPPGQYRYHDENVSYIIGGPIEILKDPC